MKGIVFIKVGKSELPVKFGFSALAEFCKLTGITLSGLSQIGENMSLDHILTLAWVGFKHGNRVDPDAGPFNLTLDDVGDMMDENPNLMEEIMVSYAESQGEKKTLPRKDTE